MKRNLIAAAAIGLAGPLMLILCHAGGVLRENWGGHLVLFISAGAAFLATGIALRGHARASDARGETVSFPRLLLHGLVISAAAMTLAALGTFVFVEFIDPSHLEFLHAEATRQIEELDLESAAKREQLAAIESWLDPLSFSLENSLNTLTLGTFASFVAAALFRGRS